VSILIEALTLVVPHRVLAMHFPGGSHALHQKLLQFPRPPRYVCDDGMHLVAASFDDSEHAAPAIALLESSGMVAMRGDHFHHMALVDGDGGPTLPCDWLVWRRHAAGYSHAWLSWTAQGELVAPEGWTPEPRRTAPEGPVCSDPGERMRIAHEHGVLTWLDLATGRLTTETAPEETPPPEPEPPRRSTATAEGDDSPLRALVLGVLEERRWPVTLLGERWACTRIRDDRTAYDLLITVNDGLRAVACYCILPTRVPEPRRPEVTEALNRANWRMLLGDLELDNTDGEVRCRMSGYVGSGDEAPAQLGAMLDMAWCTARQYHDAIIRVAYGGIDAATAIAEALDGPPP